MSRIARITTVIDVSKGKLRLRLPMIFSRQCFGMDSKVFGLDLTDTGDNRVIAQECKAICDKDIALGNFDLTFQKYKFWVLEQVEASKTKQQEQANEYISYATKAIVNLPWIIHGFLLGDSAEKLAESYQLDLQTIEEIIRLSFDIKLHPLGYYLNKGEATKPARVEEKP